MRLLRGLTCGSQHSMQCHLEEKLPSNKNNNDRRRTKVTFFLLMSKQQQKNPFHFVFQLHMFSLPKRSFQDGILYIKLYS